MQEEVDARRWRWRIDARRWGIVAMRRILPPAVCLMPFPSVLATPFPSVLATLLRPVVPLVWLAVGRPWGDPHRRQPVVSCLSCLFENFRH